MRWLWLLSVVHAAFAAVLGVDFGAEFTKSALVAPNIPFEIVLTPDSKRKDASGLLLKPLGQEFERIYGSSGTALTGRFPQSALYYLKSLLGASPKSEAVQAFQNAYPGLNLTSTARDTVQVTVGDIEIPIEEVVAMTFADIKARASDLLKSKLGSGSIKDTAVSIPAHYTMEQRRAIIDAVELSGLSLISLVDDGVAIAVNYASTRQFNEDKHYIVVYDMGAESTTSTLVSLRDPGTGVVLEVEGFGADESLGGQALTLLLRDILLDKLSVAAKVDRDVLNTPKLLNRLWREAERAKAVLSANTDVSIHIESAFKDTDLHFKLKREQLEEAADGMVARVAAPLLSSLRTFDGKDIHPDQLASVVLAGGSTRVPFVQSQIRYVAGDIISKNVNADEAACQGACLRGIGISGIFKSKPMTVVDRTMHDFRVIANGKSHRLFSPGAELGSSVTLSLPAVDEELKLVLAEDSEDILAWDVPFVASAAEQLTADGKCLDDAVVEAKFTLSTNGIVKFVDAAVRCTKPLTSASSSSSPNSTATESAEPAEEIKTKRASRYLASRPKYLGPAPLSSADKQQLQFHLRSLDKTDADRRRKDTLHNELESLLYRVRELSPDSQTVQQHIEWVESGGGSIAELNSRLEEARKLYEKLAPAAEPQPEAEPVAPSGDGERAALLISADIDYSKGVSWAEAVKKATTEQLNALKKVCEETDSAAAEELAALVDDALGHSEL